MTAIETRGFELVDWQRAAVDTWIAGRTRPFEGTFEIFTGGGKSLVALACAAQAARVSPDLRLAIVVPTEALARQWIDVVGRFTNVSTDEIGLMGAGGHDSLIDHRVLVSVLNTAARRLPEEARVAQPMMLVVDECHRAGAPTFSNVLTTPARFRLGLSATPEREEFDDDGEPLEFDEQVVGRRLGPVVYRFGLRDARQIGWLPDYSVHHHGISLLPDEKQEYDSVSRRIEDAADVIRDLGGDSHRAQQLQARNDELGRAARSYVALTSSRKDLLYRASERERVAARIVRRALRHGDRKVLLFHERVAEAEALYRALATELPIEIGLEHSRLPDARRAESLEAFRRGTAPVLVSVKSLVEGIDVPDAEVGVSVAASSSVRQRVQSLGRVLRRSFDAAGPPKTAEMHLIYVADTVDDLIYAKEDWGDITGQSVNHYWRWPLDPDARPERQDGPPASPRPTEESEWQRFGGKIPDQPEVWLGVFGGQEYSVDTMGNVVNRSGTAIRNPQGAGEMVSAVRGRPGGRFRVTPTHRLVLTTSGDGEGVVYLAGQLSEPFEAASEDDRAQAAVEVSALLPGDEYDGPADKQLGTFHTRAKKGGVIERKAQAGTEFATTDSSTHPILAENARSLLAAWRQCVDRGITFHVNQLGHAWYTEGGTRRFLADVPGGFAWPSSEG